MWRHSSRLLEIMTRRFALVKPIRETKWKISHPSSNYRPPPSPARVSLILWCPVARALVVCLQPVFSLRVT